MNMCKQIHKMYFKWWSQSAQKFSRSYLIEDTLVFFLHIWVMAGTPSWQLVWTQFYSGDRGKRSWLHDSGWAETFFSHTCLFLLSNLACPGQLLAFFFTVLDDEDLNHIGPGSSVGVTHLSRWSYQWGWQPMYLPNKVPCTHGHFNESAGICSWHLQIQRKNDYRALP